MDNKGKMIVNHPIEVPRGDYCWQCCEEAPCTYFDNEGGHGHCGLGFHDVDRTREGFYKKSPKCAAFKEVKK